MAHHDTRTHCIICKSDDVDDIFTEDYDVPQALHLRDEINKGNDAWMPYNVQRCNQCKTFQNKYLADLRILYEASHIQASSQVREKQTLQFTDFILKNPNIQGIIEIGAGAGELSDNILAVKEQSYYIIDPAYVGPVAKRTIIHDYIENVNVDQLQANTLVFSHLWEHLYEPTKLLDQLASCTNIKYVYMCHPDFDTYVNQEPYTYNCLHCEHTFFIQNHSIPELFKMYGYNKVSYQQCESYSIFFEFTKINDYMITKTNDYTVLNPNSDLMISKYFQSLFNKVSEINNILDHTTKPVYIWPCSIHSIQLFNFGLNYKNLRAILDNAPSKIGKYLYGYEIQCISFIETMNNATTEIIIILNGGCFNREIVRQNMTNKFVTFI